MPGLYHVPVPAEILLMKEFRFLPAVGMTSTRSVAVEMTAGFRRNDGLYTAIAPTKQQKISCISC